MAWYWPDINTLTKAKTAARVGAGVCFCFAVADLVIAATGAYKGLVSFADASLLDVLRLNWALTLPLLGCVLFAVAGWRIWNFSRTWAAIVLAWYLMQSLRILGFLLMLLPPPLLLTFVLITSLRGTFAYQSLTKIREEERAAIAGRP